MLKKHDDMKWTVFDLEFTQLLPASGEWPGDLHIACGSLFSSGEWWPQVWYERPPGASAALPGDYMSEPTLLAFVAALEARVQAGFVLVTWGGSASDFRMLMRECPSAAERIRALALDSVDLPMCSCMSIGMMMGLNAACKALGLDLKDADASASVPVQWSQGSSGRAAVLQHVCNDSYATMLVLKHAESTGVLPWITQRGTLKMWQPVHFWSVRTCLSKELPHVPFTIGPAHNAKLLARWLLLE